jgi:hypothetical protein
MAHFLVTIEGFFLSGAALTDCIMSGTRHNEGSELSKATPRIGDQDVAPIR